MHLSSLQSDDTQWGVAMPIIVWMDVLPKSTVDFVKNTTVTVNGEPATGAWFWEATTHAGAAVEGHYRQKNFWPAHATIEVTFPSAGTAAGPGLAFDGKLSSLTFQTGPATIGRVDGATSKLTVTSDGKVWNTFPVALGAPATPTMSGTKVIMAKIPMESMDGMQVPWSLRLTNSGEYLHAAPWNIGNINAGVPSSNGCTNMLPADAQTLFNFMQIGDPVIYTNVPGKVMPVWDGYGDWNLNWAAWAAGGQFRNH
ncbi:MAG: L,D-transpeptidase [Actinomycetia bacterium]|nr:L,D-transpeptidase [Actinomycetes bacterium]